MKSMILKFQASSVIESLQNDNCDGNDNLIVPICIMCAALGKSQSSPFWIEEGRENNKSHVL